MIQHVKPTWNQHKRSKAIFQFRFTVNPSFLHLGATLDDVINCECYGMRLTEIKRPFKHRDKHPHEITDPDSISQHEDGEIHLP